MWPWTKESCAVKEVRQKERVWCDQDLRKSDKISLPVPKSSPAEPPELTLEELKTYTNLSKEVGIDYCSDITHEKLAFFFQKEDVQLYKNSEVVFYLDGRLGVTWGWYGLRKEDVAHLESYRTSSEDASRAVDFSTVPYQDAIPLSTLLLIQKLQKAVPEIYFYISSARDDNDEGDHFLMITNRWLGIYVIDRWDSPGFRK